jgi:hypothetical protein
MRARSRAALQSTFALAALAAMVVVAATAPATALAAAPSGGPADRESPTLDDGRGTFDSRPTGFVASQSETPARERSSLIVTLRPDGDAQWTVVTRFELDNESDRAAFEDLARRSERGDTDVGFDIETFRRANRAANATVNRSMTIRSTERTTAVVPGENGTATGRLMLNFTWTAFARTSDGRLRFGSAFNTTDGTWLPGLAAGQTLEVRPPRGYGVFTATTRPRAGVLRWEGPTTFEPGDVAAVYERNGGPTATPTPATPRSPTATPTTNVTSPPGDPGLPGGLVLVGGVGGLLLLGAALLVLRRQRDDEDGTGAPAAASDGGDGGAATPDGDGSASDTAGATGGTAAAGAAEDDPEEETELLSDEERVERLLDRNGGRMKQANIVSETGWSNAKVSQLLSSMDEADRIDKLRIGRENLISLPDEDVTELDEE